MFSTGGNVLINIGPTSYGKIIPIFEERLRQMGSWLKVNGEAIYSSVPWKHQNDTINKDVWYVCFHLKKQQRILIVLLLIGIHPQKMVKVHMLLFSFGQKIQLKLHLVHQLVQRVHESHYLVQTLVH